MDLVENSKREQAARGEQTFTYRRKWNAPVCPIKGDVILHPRTSPPRDVTALSKAQPIRGRRSINTLPPPLRPERRPRRPCGLLKSQRSISDRQGFLQPHVMMTPAGKFVITMSHEQEYTIPLERCHLSVGYVWTECFHFFTP